MENTSAYTSVRESKLKWAWRRILAVIIFVSGIGFGTCAGQYMMQKEAIEHNAASYEAKTGKWAWNNQVDANQAAINMACAALGSKAKNDPSCILVGR